MDFELEQDIILCYETVGQTTICQEETQESIVPDACPDILRIADVCAQAMPERWEAREGQADVYGTIYAVILYVPENGWQLQRLELKLPFCCQTDMNGLTPQAILEVSTRLRCADARILNPRKVLLRANLVTEIIALQKREHMVCRGVINADNTKVCQRQSFLDHERIVSVPQRSFPLSEEIRLTGTEAPILLCCRGTAICTESRMIGSKLIFKGKTDVDLLLQNGDGVVERRTESFPFSQILEAKGAGEAGVCLVHLEISSLSCTQSPDDPFRLMVEAELLAQGQVRDRETATILTDLYSTTNHTDLQMQELKLYAPCEQVVIPQTLRDLLETGDVVRSVCDSRFDLGQIFRKQEGDTLTLTAQGQITVLYLDEERQLRRMEKAVEIPARVNCPYGSEATCRCVSPGELFAAPCAGGIEVRLTLEFQVLTASTQMISVVQQAQLGELRGCDTLRPSVILRLPEPDETLWDIAKACGTTKERIVQANELESEDIPRQKMLLIPSAR